MTTTIYSNKNSSSKAWIRFQRLRWTQPHGATGLGSVCVGYYLVATAVRGDLTPYMNYDYSSDDNNDDRIPPFLPLLPLLYVGATALNAVFGYRLACRDKSNSNASRMFRRAAVLQCLLCYCIVRFLPALDAVLWNRCKSLTLLLDTVIAVLLPLAILAMAWRPTQGERCAIDAAAALGSLALLLTAAYPVQLALGHWNVGYWHGSTVEDFPDDDDDNDYWTCLQRRYPMQGAAIVERW